MISQNYINLLKNHIKEKISSLSDELADYLIDNLFNVNKSNISRTIVTIVGELTFERTYYETKDRTNKFFYIDEMFLLPKYDHYDPIIEALAIDLSFDTNQLKAGQIVGQLFSTIKTISTDIREKYSIN